MSWDISSAKMRIVKTHIRVEPITIFILVKKADKEIKKAHTCTCSSRREKFEYIP